MSLKHLREAGVLLPREEWGAHELRTTVDKVSLVACYALGIAAVVLMWAGDGHGLTLVGAALFLGFMAWITYISLRAVDVQAAHFREERAEVLEAKMTLLGPEDAPDEPQIGDDASQTPPEA